MNKIVGMISLQYLCGLPLFSLFDVNTMAIISDYGNTVRIELETFRTMEEETYEVSFDFPVTPQTAFKHHDLNYLITKDYHNTTFFNLSNNVSLFSRPVDKHFSSFLCL